MLRAQLLGVICHFSIPYLDESIIFVCCCICTQNKTHAFRVGKCEVITRPSPKKVSPE